MLRHFSKVIYIQLRRSYISNKQLLLHIVPARDLAYAWFEKGKLVRCVIAKFIYSLLAQQPKAGQGRLVLEVIRSHTVTHHSR